MKTHLIQPRELFGPADRQDELKECWRRNDGLFDDYTLPEGRPTFTELFRMCKPGVINVITNSDMYFERHEVDLIAYAFTRPGCGREERKKQCLALSRWDVDPTGVAMLWDHSDSQDTWVVFGGPHEIDAPYTMGTPGCDNALIHELRLRGFDVTNPSKTIRTYHLHLSKFRSYLDNQGGDGRGGQKIYRVPPPYGFAKPTEL